MEPRILTKMARTYDVPSALAVSRFGAMPFTRSTRRRVPMGARSLI